MWRDILSFTLQTFSKMGDFASWLFTPIQYDSVFSALLKRVWNIEVWYRPVDFIGVGTLSTLLILLLIHLANVIGG